MQRSTTLSLPATVAGGHSSPLTVVPETSLPTVPSTKSTASDSEYLGFEYSILNADKSYLELEQIHWAYYAALPFMIFIACWVKINYLIWFKRIGHKLPPKGLARWLGPDKMTRWFDRAHRQAWRVRCGVTTSAALDVIYSILRYLPFRRIRSVGEFLLWFWLNQPDAQGVRNRLRLTYFELIEELERLINTGWGVEGKIIEILSLACGSAQATVEAVAYILNKYPGIYIKLLLVDDNGRSLELAKELAIRRGIGQVVTTKASDLKDFIRNTEDAWNIIEMVGYLDYRREESLISLCDKIRNILRAGDLFITAHIAPSRWAFVVQWVINWPLLIRRPQSKFVELLIRSNFNVGNIKSILDPTGTHTVACCRK